jgi:hypothetical protein
VFSARSSRGIPRKSSSAPRSMASTMGQWRRLRAGPVVGFDGASGIADWSDGWGVNFLIANPRILATRTGNKYQEIRILPFFVTPHLMPMNYVSNFELAPECFLSIEELRERTNNL